MKINDADIFYHSKGLRIRNEEFNEITIYDRNTDQIYELNSTAAYIFRIIAEVGEISKIIETYKNEYNISFEKSKTDVISVVQKLVKLHIIKKG
jgi:hypothetical protein